MEVCTQVCVKFQIAVFFKLYMYIYTYIHMYIYIYIHPLISRGRHCVWAWIQWQWEAEWNHSIVWFVYWTRPNVWSDNIISHVFVVSLMYLYSGHFLNQPKHYKLHNRVSIIAHKNACLSSIAPSLLKMHRKHWICDGSLIQQMETIIAYKNVLFDANRSQAPSEKEINNQVDVPRHLRTQWLMHKPAVRDVYIYIHVYVDLFLRSASRTSDFLIDI